MKKESKKRGEPVITALQEYVLLAIQVLGNDATCDAILHLMREAGLEPGGLGALYNTIYRMEARNWVRSHVDGSESVQGGKGRRFYVITTQGIKALERATLIREFLRVRIAPRAS